jgi:hypothetical protein
MAAALVLLGGTAGCAALLGVDDYEVREAPSIPDASSDAPLPLAPPDAGRDADVDVDASDPCLRQDKPQVDLTEVAVDTTLDCRNDYVLRNQVYVRAGAPLTIPAGTTIKGTRGDVSEYEKVSVLVVSRGARINAVGTADRPVVFTSIKPEGQKKAGDWGGVVLLGNAVVNQPQPVSIEGVGGGGNDVTYGGNNDQDSSGTLKYVRIEYGGFKLSANNEINGLTFGGVGSGTTVDYVQVRQVLDDCFEFFGGTVNASHLACQYGQDDGFDWDFGYRGKLQFLVLQQDPNIYDDMNGFEGDNGGNASQWVRLPASEPTIYNATLCGPGKPAPARPPFPDGGPGPLRARFGMLLRRHTKAHIFNSIVMGFEAGLDVTTYPSPDDAGLRTAAESLELKNVLFFGNTHAVGDDTANLAFKEDLRPGLQALLYTNDDQGFDEIEVLTPLVRTDDPGITGCFTPSSPSFGPATTIESEVVPPAISGLVPVGYVGAFRDKNDPWATAGSWAVWKAD